MNKSTRQFIKDNLGKRMEFTAKVSKPTNNQVGLATHVYCNGELVSDHIWLQQMSMKIILPLPTEVSFTAVCYEYGSGTRYGLKQVKEVFVNVN